MHMKKLRKAFDMGRQWIYTLDLFHTANNLTFMNLISSSVHQDEEYLIIFGKSEIW